MLELQNISFHVSDETDEKGILKDVSFTLKNHKFVAITGPNGGGKSTLAKIIAGIEKPTSGRILLDGEDITERAHMGISYAFQQPVRFKGVTVLDLIRLAAGKQLSAAGACKYLSEVGLCAKDYINREVNGSLSGGEIKRIEIATVMARGTRISVFEVFEKMHEEMNGSILIISHQERILKTADEILVVADGKVADYGERDQILPSLLGGENSTSGCKYWQREEK